MTGMLINLHTWRGFTDKAEIDIAVDHKAVVQIMKAKHPPVSPRVEVLLEKMLSDPFNLYYVKGKDLILADFLSRIRSDHSDPTEVIPISFVDMKARLRHPALHFHGHVMRSTAKREGLVMPPVHGSDKLLDPHRKPEHQTDLPPKNMPLAPPILVQRPFKRTVIPPSATQVMSQKLIDRSVKILRSKRDHKPQVQSQIPLKLPQMDPLTPKEPSTPQINDLIPRDIPEFDPRELHLPQNPHKPETIYQPSSYVPAKGKQLPPMPLDMGIDMGNPITNYHDLVNVVVQHPNHDELEPPIPLSCLVDTSKIARRRLPQQSEIDPLLKEIQMKILRQVHLLTSFRDLKGAYLNSTFFRDIYLLLSQNKAPSNPRKKIPNSFPSTGLHAPRYPII